MKTTFITFCLILVSGCGATLSQERTSGTMTVDQSVPGITTTHYDQQGTAKSFSAGLPMGGMMGPMMAGGYGLPIVGMDSCMSDPRVCAGQWVTTPIVNVTGTPSMSGGTQVIVQGGNASADPALAGRVSTVEKRVDNLQTVELRNACRQFMKDPSQVADAAKRQKQIETCNQVLGGK